jgi:hypothetical protein
MKFDKSIRAFDSFSFFIILNLCSTLKIATFLIAKHWRMKDWTIVDERFQALGRFDQRYSNRIIIFASGGNSAIARLYF